MLVLSRRLHERIKIEVGDTVVWISVVKLNGGQVRLGFEGPEAALITRNEVLPAPQQYPDGASSPVILGATGGRT